MLHIKTCFFIVIAYLLITFIKTEVMFKKSLKKKNSEYTH